MAWKCLLPQKLLLGRRRIPQPTDLYMYPNTYQLSQNLDVSKGALWVQSTNPHLASRRYSRKCPLIDTTPGLEAHACILHDLPLCNLSRWQGWIYPRGLGELQKKTRKTNEGNQMCPLRLSAFLIRFKHPSAIRMSQIKSRWSFVAGSWYLLHVSPHVNSGAAGFVEALGEEEVMGPKPERRTGSSCKEFTV